MYTITLEVNQKCNLCCRYCYLKSKNNSEMPYETATQCIDFAIHNTTHHKDRRLWVDLVGGEPLLSFTLLKRIVKYTCNSTNKSGLLPTFSLTTNGTIMTEDILDWLITNHIHIKLSIDGRKNVHNLNRVYPTGIGSHSDLIRNLPSFKTYEHETHIPIQATHVITKNNLYSSFDTCKYLVEELGMSIIDTALDLSCDWSESDLETISQETEKTLLLYIQHKNSQNPFLWGTVVDMQNYRNKLNSCYKCGAGLISSYIRTNGDIYACSANLINKYRLGTLDNGFEPQKLEMLKHIKEIKNGKCHDCHIYNYCTAKCCIMNSLRFNESIDLPSSLLCRVEQIKYKLYEKYKESLVL